MTSDLPERAFLTAIALLPALSLPTGAAALDLQAYEAVYDVFMDGKRRMEVTARLEPAGAGWQLSNDSRGVKGLARFLKVMSAERARFEWIDGSVRPQEFSHRSRAAGREDHWTASFDRKAGTVNTTYEDGMASLDLPEEAFDPLTLNFALRARLESGMQDWSVLVVDEDELDEHLYAVQAPVRLDTALGCMDAIPVERVRENSQRFSDGWYAPALAYLPVRIHHGKRGDREFDMRIRSLTIGGEKVDATDPCH